MERQCPPKNSDGRAHPPLCVCVCGWVGGCRINRDMEVLSVTDSSGPRLSPMFNWLTIEDQTSPTGDGTRDWKIKRLEAPVLTGWRQKITDSIR